MTGGLHAPSEDSPIRSSSHGSLNEAIQPRALDTLELERAQIDAIASGVPGGAANIQDIYPLSPLQEGMLFHHLMNRRDTYVLSTLLELESRSKVDRLIEALRKLIDRHDILRTAIAWEQLPKPVQVVYREVELPVEELSLPADRDAVAELRASMSPGRLAFDLRRAPLLRLRFAADRQSSRWYAVLYVHHIACDHQSLRTIVSETMAYMGGREEQLPPSVPFKTYVSRVLASAQTTEAERYFKQRLGDLVEPSLPFGLVDVYGDGERIQESRLHLEAGMARRIREGSQRLGVSAARVFHAAWAMVVARTTGLQDAVFGTVLLASEQRRPQAQRMLGLSVNTLPLRLHIANVNVSELIEQTHRELLELSKYEATPLALAQRCSGLADGGPLFSSILNYRRSVPSQEPESCDVDDVRVVARGEAWTNYPITVTVDDLGEGFSIMAKCDRRISPESLLAYLATALDALTTALEQHPGAAADALSILPESERRQVLEWFNATESPVPSNVLIHELIEAQVAQTPYHVAVQCNGSSLTYAQLNTNANRLARYFRKCGVAPEELVAVYLEPSVDLVVALLAILKSGGAYVPLDPSLPRERVNFVLTDAKPCLLVTRTELLTELAGCSTRILAIDAEQDQISAKSAENLVAPPKESKDRQLAYVIYTSGSTGRPKGVLIEHGNIVNYSIHVLRRLGVAEGDGSLICSSFGFDLALTGFYPVLLSGRTVRLCAEGQGAWSLQEELLRCKNLAPLKLTPSHLALLNQPLRSGLLTGRVRSLVLGGEPLPASIVRQWKTHAPGTRIFNHYGPTETTVGCAVGRVDDLEGEIVPIGRPISNTKIYVLDPRLQPVPIGAVGEIYVAGAGVARGYLNRPELTAERFGADPFHAVAGARMYKTGDLGRWRADGTLEFLGRNDDQIKVRGYRIEPAEIAAQLSRHHQVAKATVIAHVDAAGQKRLVAYAVRREGAAPTVESLRAHLASLLPEYMIPSAFVLLDAMPLTPNGKLDRHALPPPQFGVGRPYEPPQGEIERMLAALWRSLLQVERVGRLDNFFELGGHSLLVLQMLEGMKRLGLAADVRRVFESATLAELASAIDQDRADEGVFPPNLIPLGSESITPDMLTLIELEPQHLREIAEAVPGGAANIQDIYPLTPLQEGILFHHMLLNERAADAYVVPHLLTLSSRQRLDELIDALQAVIDRHDILRTAVLWKHLPASVQVVYRKARLAIEEVLLDQALDPESQVRDWLEPERQRLDLGRAPLMRLRVAAGSGGRWYALVQTHHIACDHVALGLVIAEVVAHLEGKAHTLPAPVPYRRHVARLLEDSKTHDSASFFRRKLEGIDEPTAPFGVLDIYSDATGVEEATLDLAAQCASQVRARASQLAVSPAVLFHAAWSLVVACTSGRKDVVFGTVLLGRWHGGLAADRTLGMTINTLPVRVRLRDVTVREAVAQVQRQLMELLDHDQASLATVQQCSEVPATLPLFTTVLNFRHGGSSFESLWGSASGLHALAVQGRTNYPITVSIDDSGSGFRATAQTDRRIDPRRLLGYLVTAIRSLVNALEKAPDTPVGTLSVLPASERHRVVHSFNDTRVPRGPRRFVHELFEDQARRTPDAVALVHRGASLTYEGLERASNALAQLLRRRGIQPGDRVGIFAERASETVIGLLGTLKAGAAYVPLDPALPRERLHLMLKDSAPRLVLAREHDHELQPANAAEILEFDQALVPTVDDDEKSLTPIERAHTTSDLLYVIYTSGSTGVPKGTMMPHEAMVNLMEWHARNLPCEGHRVLQFASLSFDVAFQEIFSTLCAGGTLVLLDDWIRKDVRAFADFMRRERINRVFLPPLMLEGLAEHCCATGSFPESLMDVVTAGEPLRVTSPIKVLFERIAGCRLHNHYGPTETHVVTSLTLSGRPNDWPARPPIGRPLANMQIYVMDPRLRPLPVGVMGEICVAGVGLSCGYLNRPELTAERSCAIQ